VVGCTAGHEDAGKQDERNAEKARGTGHVVIVIYEVR
jgi:hypothetical protein